ncbi:MAG: S41 family peptidase [Bacteroidales bacterium]|nr:S41 family peptidase [Bacteroidales bacterium]
MRLKKALMTMGCVAVAGAVACVFLGFKNDKRNFEIIKNLDIFYSVFKELNAYYVDETDPKKLIKKAIDEMLGSLDPYTNYIPEEEMADFKFMTTGEYGGVGSIISASDTCYVMFREVYEGKPADRAGIRNGDYIVEINGKSAKNMKVSDISENLRGEPNTEAKVKIWRIGEPKLIEKSIRREKVQINPVSFYDMVDGNIGYIDFNNFTQDCSKEIETALSDLKKRGATKLILDMRDNPGGLLDEAIKIVSMFVPKGSEVLSTKGKISMYDKTYRTTKEPIDTQIPIVVLVSRSSASAAEIVAGALQDLDRAVIVGQRSFGKGLVQSTREIEYNGGLKLTTAKYYIPSGRCIQAIDYSHRNKDGAVGLVADSLISEFKTANGRKVYDGGGVSPDVHVTLPSYSNISYAVVANDLIFRYAVQYRSTHPTIAPAEDFKLSDADYQDFCKFVAQNTKFTYKNESDEEFKKLVSAAKRNKYYDANKELFDQMGKALAPDLDKDIAAARDEIQDLLESQILISYYYNKGAAKHAVKSDEVITEAVKTINDEARYKGLLDGTVASHAGDKRGSIEKD